MSALFLSEKLFNIWTIRKFNVHYFHTNSIYYPIFQFFLLSNCKKFGRQSWVVLSIIATEFLIIAKFDWQTITKPLPRHIFYSWVGCAFLLFLWTIWNFFLRRVTKVLYKRKDSIESKRSPNKLDSNNSDKTISNKSNGSTIDKQMNSHKKRK